MLWSVPSVWQSLAGWAVSCAHMVWTAAVFSTGWAEHFGVSCDAAVRSHLLWMGLLHGAEWWTGLYGAWMGLHRDELNRAKWGLNGAWMGQSYGADLGPIWLGSLCWSFWYLPCFSLTTSCHLNGATWGLNGATQAEWWTGPNRGQMGPKWGSCMGLILVPYDSAHLPDHFDAWLVFLWPLVAIWMGPYGAWMGLHGAEQWMGPYGDWTGPKWASCMGRFLYQWAHLIKCNLDLSDPLGCRWHSICLAGNDLGPWRGYT